MSLDDFYPWFGILATLAGVSTLMVTLSLFQRRRQPDPECLRKLMHVGGGITALPFPWLFHTVWPVILLAIMTTVGLVAVRSVKGLRQRCGRVIGGVERQSSGDLLFPGATGLLFVLSEGDPILFTIPLLILTFADTAAALVGSRYGSHRYGAVGGEKSLEGSISFLFIAVLCTLIPIVLFTGRGAIEAMATATLVGLALMTLEAIAGGGIDNASIPIGGFFVLRTSLGMTQPDQTVYLFTMVVLIIILSLLQTSKRVLRSRVLHSGAGTPGLTGTALLPIVDTKSPRKSGWHFYRPRVNRSFALDRPTASIAALRRVPRRGSGIHVVSSSRGK